MDEFDGGDFFANVIVEFLGFFFFCGGLAGIDDEHGEIESSFSSNLGFSERKFRMVNSRFSYWSPMLSLAAVMKSTLSIHSVCGYSDSM